MVLHKYGNVLYDGIVEVLKSHLEEKANKAASVDVDENFLLELTSTWNDYMRVLKEIEAVTAYMVSFHHYLFLLLHLAL